MSTIKLHTHTTTSYSWKIFVKRQNTYHFRLKFYFSLVLVFQEYYGRCSTNRNLLLLLLKRWKLIYYLILFAVNLSCFFFNFFDFLNKLNNLKGLMLSQEFYFYFLLFNFPVRSCAMFCVILYLLIFNC